MRAKRTTIRTAAAFAGLLMAVTVTGPMPAVAGGPADHAAQAAKGDQVLIAPPAPLGARLTAEVDAAMGIAAVEPQTTPGVTSHPIAPGGTYTCSAGYFCPIVWNPVTGMWKIFFMYYCRIQTLYDWIGDGYYYNNQIPPVDAVQLYDQYGGLIGALAVENPRRQRPYNWSPVWSLDVC